MPGITANLTPQAYAIWETIPKKEARNPDRPGRSAILSQAIIERENWIAVHDAILKEKYELEDQLRMMTRARDCLQELVLQ
jgi:hypothetical protein